MVSILSRLHTKCPSCKASIVVSTDPKDFNQVCPYKIVIGEAREFERGRDKEKEKVFVEQRLDRPGREEDERMDNFALQKIENVREAAKTEMAVANALDALQIVHTRRQ